MNTNFTKAIKNGFKITVNKSEELYFQWKTLEEKEEWFSKIVKALQEVLKQSLIFGVSLSSIIDREKNPSGIPTILEKSVQHIRSLCMPYIPYFNLFL